MDIIKRLETVSAPLVLGHELHLFHQMGASSEESSAQIFSLPFDLKPCIQSLHLYYALSLCEKAFPAMSSTLSGNRQFAYCLTPLVAQFLVKKIPAVPESVKVGVTFLTDQVSNLAHILVIASSVSLIVSGEKFFGGTILLLSNWQYIERLKSDKGDSLSVFIHRSITVFSYFNFFLSRGVSLLFGTLILKVDALYDLIMVAGPYIYPLERKVDPAVELKVTQDFVCREVASRSMASNTFKVDPQYRQATAIPLFFQTTMQESEGPFQMATLLDNRFKELRTENDERRREDAVLMGKWDSLGDRVFSLNLLSTFANQLFIKLQMSMQDEIIQDSALSIEELVDQLVEIPDEFLDILQKFRNDEEFKTSQLKEFTKNLLQKKKSQQEKMALQFQILLNLNKVIGEKGEELRLQLANISETTVESFDSHDLQENLEKFCKTQTENWKAFKETWPEKLRGKRALLKLFLLAALQKERVNYFTEKRKNPLHPHAMLRYPLLKGAFGLPPVEEKNVQIGLYFPDAMLLLSNKLFYSQEERKVIEDGLSKGLSSSKSMRGLFSTWLETKEIRNWKKNQKMDQKTMNQFFFEMGILKV